VAAANGTVILDGPVRPGLRRRDSALPVE